MHYDVGHQGNFLDYMMCIISSYIQMRTEKETRLLVHIENARFGKVGDKVNQVKDQLSQGQGQYDNTLWEENVSLSLSYSFLYFPICNW